ncbi:MAG: tetratricopeptide repeat protein [Treponema sp.]|jgi:tetratricopeptide (TPR) repeat protein|nr:tetratricopeptide repeat protein [Treponema sp.]
MKNSALCFIPILLLFRLAAFAQTPDQSQTAAPPSALENYRTGRNLEAQNRMAEANVLYNEAIRMCQDEVARNVATRDTYTTITWTMQRQNRYADVLVWGERGLRLFPNEYRIIETMGEACFYQGDYNRSLSLMQRYVNAVPQGERTSVAYFFIGEIYRLTQKYRHADIAYTTAVRLESGAALWWYRLGTVREAAGDRVPSAEAYRQALRLNPNYREARDGLTRVEN